MQCPVCKDVTLVMSDRQGIEIDYCPSCRGVWLDRGELDKIIEKSSSATAFNSRPSSLEHKSEKQHYTKYDNHNSHSYPKKKKEGFLSDIFDFDF